MQNSPISCEGKLPTLERNILNGNGGAVRARRIPKNV